MGVILIAITSVIHHGVILQPGEEFACELGYAKKLIKGGSAMLKGATEAENVPKTDENGEIDSENGGNAPISDTDFFKKLDGLTVPKLKEITKKHQISLASEDKKDEIIQKIIDSGVDLDEEDI